MELVILCRIVFYVNVRLFKFCEQPILCIKETYLLKKGTTSNHAKPLETFQKLPETT